MGFRGNLQDLALSDILQVVQMTQKSGILEIVDGARATKILFREGNIVDAQPPSSGSLTEYLAARKLLPPGAADAAEKPGGPRGERIGEALIRLGLVNTEDLRVALAARVEETIHAVLTWEHGRFEFSLAEDAPGPIEDLLPGLNLDTQHALMEALRVFDERREARGTTVPLAATEPAPEDAPEPRVVVVGPPTFLASVRSAVSRLGVELVETDTIGGAEALLEDDTLRPSVVVLNAEPGRSDLAEGIPRLLASSSRISILTAGSDPGLFVATTLAGGWAHVGLLGSDLGPALSYLESLIANRLEALALDAGAPAAADEATDGLTADEARMLREIFATDAAERFAALDGLGPRTPLRERAKAIGKLGHFLAGTGAAGGYPELSSAGQAIEAAIDEAIEGAELAPGTETLVANLQQTLARIGAAIRAGRNVAEEARGVQARLRPKAAAAATTAAPAAAKISADILVVDDERISQAAIGSILRRAGFSIREAYSGAEALAAVAEKTPDLIILDVRLPDIDGHEVLARMRADPRLQLVPVVFVTARQRLDDKIQALRTGADDYITKPFSPEELAARVASRLERAEISRDLALRDGLTGLYNHRFLQERLGDELARFARYKTPFALAILDIDHFKSFNDRFGHQVGDSVLRTLSARLMSSLRTADIIARYGGEEFAIIFTETALDDALPVLDRLRAAIADGALTKSADGEPLRVTFSAGIADPRAGESKEELIRRADAALYESKHAGRNRVTRANLT